MTTRDRDASASQWGTEPTGRLATCVREGVARVVAGVAIAASPRMLELCGVADLASLRDEPFAARFRARDAGAVGPRAGHATECVLVRSNGDERPVVCRIERVGGPDEELWVIEDVSRVRRLEQELIALSRDLHAANREVEAARDELREEHSERESLMEVVSHELRTPITIIAGYNRLLLSEEAGPLIADQKRFLEESTRGCDRLSAFVDSLLASSRERRGVVLEVAQTSIASILEDVVGLLRPLLSEQEVGVQIDVEPADCHASCDRMRVEQVITNLLTNALRVSKPGGTVSLSARELTLGGWRPTEDCAASSETGARSEIEISVADEGPGVPERDRERIFDPYVQAGDRAGGLGLGLAICRRIVEAHGGSIRVTDRDGGGSRFSFTLPRAHRERPITASDPAPAENREKETR